MPLCRLNTPKFYPSIIIDHVYYRSQKYLTDRMASHTTSAFLIVVLATLAAEVAGGNYFQEVERKLLGKFLRFKSYNYPQNYIRHRNYWVRTDRAENSKLFKLDSTWKIVRGLCGKGISFQSKNYPQLYLRHQNYRARIDRLQNTKLFKLDACFIPHTGLADYKGFSFESVNFKNFYLRHSNYLVRIDRNNGDGLYQKDGTFMAEPSS